MSKMQHSELMDLARHRPKPFLDFLSQDQIALLKESGHRRSLSDGQFIHSRGDNEPGISFIEKGAARAGIYGPDGGFILTSFIGPGHSFGEFTVFTDLPLSHDISAVGPTTLINIPAQKFLDLCGAEPAYLAALLRATLLRSHVLIEMLHALRLLPLVPRVAKYLLIMAPYKSSNAKLRFRQTDFAATLGLSRASMNRALSELEDLGLISRSYGCVEICSVPGLSRWLEHAVGDD